MTIYGAVEGGGTKWVCGVGSAPEDLETISIPTTTPAETLGRVIRFFETKPVSALGVASFGPLDLKTGFITSTPKPGWANTDVSGSLGRALRVPVGFDTDVNAAALGEAEWGEGRGLDDFVYLTVGTGIGGGAVVNSQLLHGNLHPEMGHLPVPHDLASDPFPGSCPFHGDCLEGLASGPAIEKRWGSKAEHLPPDHPAWALEARYLACGLAALLYTLSPRKIIVGGGMAEAPWLLPLVRIELTARLNGYLLGLEAGNLIVAPGLGRRSGIAGALLLARQALSE
jgi:fructokinase